MQIVESFLCGKENNPATCEDGIYIGEQLVAVIDGVTAKGHRLWNGHKSGYYAKEVLLNYLKQDGIVQQKPEEFMKNLDGALRESIESQGADLKTEEYPRASIIIYNDIYKEIWNYGDCQCSINGTVYTHAKEIDEINAKRRAHVLEEALKNGMSCEELSKMDLGRIAILENLRTQFDYENKKGGYGYPILNGMGIEPSMLCVYQVKAGDEVILASDGYPKLEKRLKESEEALSHILQKDPMCFRLYPSTKGVKEGNISFDDRAFCRIVVTVQP